MEIKIDPCKLLKPYKLIMQLGFYTIPYIKQKINRAIKQYWFPRDETRSNRKALNKLIYFEPTFPAVVPAVKQGCLPSYRPNAAVRAWILWLNLSVKIGTSIVKMRQSKIRTISRWSHYQIDRGKNQVIAIGNCKLLLRSRCAHLFVQWNAEPKLWAQKTRLCLFVYFWQLFSSNR